jgi:hypothetical protein
VLAGPIDLSEKQYQTPAGLARNCRFFSIRRPGPQPRAFALSVAIGLCQAVGVEAGLGERVLALDETLFGLRAAEDSAILGRFRLAPLAFP